MSDILFSVDADTRTRSGPGELGARMRSLLEWEKAFLAEQHHASLKNETSGTGGESPGGTPTPEAGFVGSKSMLGPSDAQQTSRDAAHGLPPDGRHVHDASISYQRATANPAPGAAPATRRVTETGKTGFKAPEAVRNTTFRHAGLSQAFPGMLITMSGDAAQVWLRQPGFESTTGLGTMMKLRELLMRAGLRLSSITVNGVLQWSEEGAAAQSWPDRSETGMRVDKRV